MAKSTFQNTQIGKRVLKLTNLEKSIYKTEKILKAEVIKYYYSVAPTMLKYIKGRPLSLIRYPDGIEGEVFYQKNKEKSLKSNLAYINMWIYLILMKEL